MKVPCIKPRLAIAAVVLISLVAAGVAADWWSALPPGIKPSYVGRDTCARCHADQLRSWTDSDHALAMDLATDKTVEGNFDDQHLTHLGIQNRMFRRDGKFFITTDGPDGKPATYPIKYTFGVHPLQQYLVEFPRGRVQSWSVAWDTEHERWFDLHPNEKIPADDWLHWTKAGQNWNYMCAECHSTDLKKNYDLQTDSYHTTFSEISVSCEDCHGPGSLHVELAEKRSLFWDRNYGYGLAKMKDQPNRAQIDVCARCHSRRRVMHGGYQPGDEFLDFYDPELLDGEIYYPDGQIRDEDYEYGSFLQSRMYRENVRCTDCHDPHTSRLRAQGNQLCVRCHTAGKYDGPTHHHHAVGSKGSSCVECHMPVRKYMVVDPRRDHSIRIPRPDLTRDLGTPNACQACHEKKSPQWAIDTLDQWFEDHWRADPHYGRTIAAGRQADPHVETALLELARNRPSLPKAKQVGPIVRASAVALLGRYGTPASLAGIEQALDDPEPLVRAAAVRQMQPPQRESGAIELLRTALLPKLNDPIRLVRTDAARELSAVPADRFQPDDWKKLQTVLAEWREGLKETSDDAGSHLALGLVDSNLGQIDEARRQYRLAIELHPTPLQAIQGRVQLGQLENAQGNTAEAEKLFRQVVKLEPKWDEGHYSLGLLLAESEGRLPEAAESLAKAVALSPRHPRMQYNLGLALEKLGKPAEAENHLRRAAELDPTSPDCLYALVTVLIERRQWKDATDAADRLEQLDPRYRGLKQKILNLSNRPRAAGPAAP
jgi:predicted CXXCH cytochrome family protein